MTKWEYSTLEYNEVPHPTKLYNELQAMGQEGWELVMVISYKSPKVYGVIERYIFKRNLTEQIKEKIAEQVREWQQEELKNQPTLDVEASKKLSDEFENSNEGC